MSPRRRVKMDPATVLIAAVTCALGSAYLWGALGGPDAASDKSQATTATTWLGVEHWAFVAMPWPWVFLTVAVLAGAAVGRWPEQSRRTVLALGGWLARTRGRITASALSVAVFWLARSHQANPDGNVLQQKFSAAMASGHAFVTHDEMLEFYVHYQLWTLLRASWGWDVTLTYRLLSCLSGGVAVFLALGLQHRFAASRWPLVVAGLFAGGWVLIFFGDVENYTLANVVALGYLTAALRFLDRPGTRLWPLASVLGIATLFHLQALDLAPSLLVLARIRWRQGARVDTLAALLTPPGLLIWALWWFDHHGLPITDLLTHSQVSAQGGHYTAFLAPMSVHYLWAQLQLLLLLAPAIVLIPALLTRPVRPHNRYALFLGVAAAGPLLMVVLWRAQLGQYYDWDLFAITGPPVALFVFSALATKPRIDKQAPWLATALVLMTLQAITWIAQHHTPLPT